MREPSAAQADAERLASQIDMAARNVAYAQRNGEVDPAVDARLVSAAFLGAFLELMAEAMSREVTPSRQYLLDTIWRLGASIIPSALSIWKHFGHSQFNRKSTVPEVSGPRK
ncbi:hypothetical protein [Rhodococcus sp. MS16]|uniref:hypothetical protein n=1 Tax=Rhodococcus sp. MS16 TaxID=2579941 RepID=UPI00156252E0|nr:hypothetical protein [Rhodococcus sp. MS16]